MRRLLLDANTLLLLFVGMFDRQQIKKFKRTAVFEIEDFDLLVDLINRFGMPVTSPNILTEVSNLSGQFAGDLRLRFFSVFAQALVSMDERDVTSKAASTHAVFTRLGLTDAVICHLAEEHSLIVVTTDLALWAHLTSKKVDCHNFNHLRSSRMLPFAP